MFTLEFKTILYETEIEVKKLYVVGMEELVMLYEGTCSFTQLLIGLSSGLSLVNSYAQLK